MNVFEQMPDWNLRLLFADVVLDEVDNTKRFTLKERVDIKNAYWERGLR